MEFKLGDAIRLAVSFVLLVFFTIRFFFPENFLIVFCATLIVLMFILNIFIDVFESKKNKAKGDN